MNDLSFFDFSSVDPSWYPHIVGALEKMPPQYLSEIKHSNNWLPGIKKIFSAFSLPLDQVNYVLLGESPYPRAQSANGYAFWDAAVTDIWGPAGLSKPVNRATSLRNMIKMLLVAEGLLAPNETKQTAIAQLTKQKLVQTIEQLFGHLLNRGFLLLNASLVLKPTNKRLDSTIWRPFIKEIIAQIAILRPNACLLLFGGLANEVSPELAPITIKKISAEHPYNLSFINNPTVLEFFRPLHLLIN